MRQETAEATAPVNATAVVRRALAGTGVGLVASCGVRRFDEGAPPAFRSAALFPAARGLIVAGSAGPELWGHLRRHLDAERARWDEPHPLDRFVAAILDAADGALARAGVTFRRFEPSVQAEPRLDFVAMARLVGLGSPGPFGLLIHPEHGPWWALRGAWLVDAAVEDPDDRPAPCVGCAAPCVGGRPFAAGLARATAETRGRCVVGQASRYDDDQIAYHYDRVATVARLRRG